MSSFPVDNCHDDNELVSRAKAGDSVALSMLIEKYSDYILKKACSYKSLYGIDSEDLYQEGMIGFVSSVYSFDDSYGTKFSTYSSVIYSRNMLTAIRKTNKDVSSYIDSNISIDDSELLSQHPSPEDVVLYDEKLNEVISFAKSNFSKTEQKVFKLILLGISYVEIAEILDCNVKSIDNAVQRIRRKLREFKQ